ncbi:hypothetical protein TRIUR3_21276 [Triticum urartu]|uniref:Uncharacterized protein n=1 Tax=Triticum urartu TaxID=4572 RepID=M7Y5M6_TRIUA|nr:hypothetical protein TRIUR3_21276 [Triticum urartu]
MGARSWKLWAFDRWLFFLVAAWACSPEEADESFADQKKCIIRYAAKLEPGVLEWGRRGCCKAEKGLCCLEESGSEVSGILSHSLHAEGLFDSQENERMGSKFNALWKNELLALGKDDKDKAITVRNDYPKPPVPCFEITEDFDLEKVEELMLERDIKIAKSMANDIIIPDPAPKKIFLDTIRLLAEKTNNLLEELWNYIEDGKIIQSAVLLLAAQEQIRGVSSSKINGSSKKNGFEIIEKCIMRHSYALRNEKGSLGMVQELLEERKTLNDCAWLLVDVISHAGEDLSAYIQAHSVVRCFRYIAAAVPLMPFT